MSLAVFLGPSLPRRDAEAIVAADYRPPVRQGDIYRLVSQARPEAIAVIDGYFQEVPSVWHKEILWALDQGVAVYGASSMGALRAAELHRHGMIGVGKVFEAYSSGTYRPYEGEPFEDDDEVAVIHGPAELSYPALSDAMVDLRETLAAAAAAGVIDIALRDALVAAFKRRFYRDRRFDALPAVLAELDVAPEVAEHLVGWLEQGRVYQKQADARALLQVLAEGGLEAPPAAESFVFERTTLWAQFVEHSAEAAAGVSKAEQRVLDELRLDPMLAAALRTVAALRHQLQAEAPLPAPDDAARRGALDRLRRRHGLWSRQALDAWARDCDLDRAGLNRLLDYEATVEASVQAAGPALDLALLDVLRSEDRYRSLAERALDKAHRLTDAPVTAPSAQSSGPLLDWYFEGCLRRGVPDDLARYAAELGFGGVKELLGTLARERAYVAKGGAPAAWADDREVASSPAPG
jgi:hypothetical protein